MDVASTWGFESALAAVRVGQPVFRGLHGRASGLAPELHETFSVTFDPFAGLDALASKRYPYAQGVFPVVGSPSRAQYSASGPRHTGDVVGGIEPKIPEPASSQKHSGTPTSDNRAVTGKSPAIGTVPSSLADRDTPVAGAQPEPSATSAAGAAVPFTAGGPPRAGHRPSQSLLSDALRGSVATQALLPAAQAVQQVDSSATRRTVSAGAVIGGQGVVALLRDAARVDARGGKSSAHEVPSEAAHASRRPEVLVGQQQLAGRGGPGSPAAPITPRDDVSISGNSSVGGGGPGYFRVTVYLPSREALTLRVPDTASVLDVIGEVLRQLREGRAVRTEPASKSSRRGSGSVQQHRSHASRSNGAAAPSADPPPQPPLGPLEGDARCYEMRLHDEDGLPDEDFPPLERSRRLKAFGQQGGHEYCLRALPGMLAAFRASAPVASGASTVGGSTASARASRQASIISDSVSVTSSEGRGTHVSGAGGREGGSRRAAALAPPFPASSTSASSSASSSSSSSSSSSLSLAPPAPGPSPASSRTPTGTHRSEGAAGSGGAQAPPTAGAGAGAGAASGHGGPQAPAPAAALASAPSESHDEMLTVLIANHTDEAALPSSLFLPLLAGASTVADVVAQVSSVVDLPPGIGLWVCLLPEDQARLCLSRPELPGGTRLSLCGVDTIIVHAAYMQAAAPPPPAAQAPAAAPGAQTHESAEAADNHTEAGLETGFGYGAAAPATAAAAAPATQEVVEEEEVAPALPARTGRYHSGGTVHALSLSQPHPSSGGIAAEGLQRLSDRLPPPPPTRYVRSATASPVPPSELAEAGAAADGRPSSGPASPQPGSTGSSPGGSAASSTPAGHRRDGAAGEASATTLSSPVGAAAGFGGPESASSGYAMPADSPAAGSGGGGGGADTARDWQEWPVVKINTRGRRQNRLFGIDRDRITNRKVEKRRLLSDRTVHAERRVADIVRVEVPAGAGNAFAITYRSSPDSDEEGDAGGKSGGGGSGSEATLRYETRTATERVELLHKLRAALAAQRKEGVVVQVP